MRLKVDSETIECRDTKDLWTRAYAAYLAKQRKPTLDAMELLSLCAMAVQLL